MNIGVLKTATVIAAVLLVVVSAGCTDIGAQITRYQSPNICHGALEDLTFAKVICGQFSVQGRNATENLTPGAGP
jgi:hypothetical protein